MATDISTFICEQIVQAPDRSPTFERTHVMIRCPYHKDGQERTPSFKINLSGSRYEEGTCFCYGCKIRTNWNDLASKLGLQQLKASGRIHDVGTFSFRDFTYELPDIRKMIDWPDQDWRGISSSTIRKYKGRLEFVSREVRLYLPVLMGKDYVGGIHCVMDITREEKEQGRKAYLNTDGTWAHSAVYGFNQAAKMSGPLITVEGPRDTLNVAQLGGRVVGFLGAAVTENKVRRVLQLNPPYVISLFDPDDAGDMAHKKLVSSMRDHYIPVVRVRLPEGKDPANLTAKTLRKVYQLAEEKRRIR